MTEAPTREILDAYREHERALTISKTRLGCAIGIVLVPFFTLLDQLVYPQHVPFFFKLRVGCSAVMALLYPLLGTALSRKYFRVQGLVLLALPTICISWMIYEVGRTDGDIATPYYAGLNLVLMVLAVVLDWVFWQSLVAVVFVIGSYLLAAHLAGPVQYHGWFMNNIWFLTSTSIVIIAGTYFHSKLRFSEFASRYQLDKNREALAQQNRVLEETLKQLKETELQLIQTEKIVSLGRLSAGIIHEINNPLNFATTALYTLRQQGERLAREKPADFDEVLQDINDGLQRVKNIVSDLRSFTHPDSAQLDEVQLSEVVRTCLRFLVNEWKDKVTVVQSVPDDLFCRANRNKLMQVFVNLLQNALDALKHRPASAEPPKIEITGRRDDGKCIVTVRDNGEGIEPQNLAKIFDPFFTTRDVGKGMGMGLSICHRIISDCHGQISVRSERGKFCEFIITLPNASAQSIAA
jgi:two-component system, sensor histidine kinase PhcS